MLSVKPIIRFVVGFAIVYGLLLVPWVGWPEFYGQYFRGMGSAVFGAEEGDRIVRFEAHTDTRGFASLDSRIVLANHARLQDDGKMPVIMLGLDSRGMGWIPTALTIALIVTTPVPWSRRFRALLWGLFWIHSFILATIAVYIWQESPAVGLTTFSPFWEQVANGMKYILVELYGADFYVPVLIWMAVTFQKEDVRRFADTLMPQSASP